jgi:hypothetical protein
MPEGPFPHIHENTYRPDEFNASGRGDACFSPLVDAEGKIIPTLYGGNTFICAAMETDIDGLYWTSRQDDAAQACMLFGDRVSEADLKIELNSDPLQKPRISRM